MNSLQNTAAGRVGNPPFHSGDQSVASRVKTINAPPASQVTPCTCPLCCTSLHRAPPVRVLRVVVHAVLLRQITDDGRVAGGLDECLQVMQSEAARMASLCSAMALWISAAVTYRRHTMNRASRRAMKLRIAGLFGGGVLDNGLRCRQVDAMQLVGTGKLDVHQSRLRNSSVLPFADGRHADVEHARNFSHAAKCVDYFDSFGVLIHAHMIAQSNIECKPWLTII